MAAYQSKAAVAKLLECAVCTLTKGVNAGEIKTRTPKGKKRSLIHTGDAQQFLKANPPRRYDETGTRRKYPITDITWPEAANILGCAESSLRHWVSDGILSLTRAGVLAHKAKRDKGMVAPPQRMVATPSMREAKEKEAEASAKKKTHEANITARKDWYEAGDICSRSKVEHLLSRLAATVKASLRQLEQQAAINLADALATMDIPPEKWADADAAVRAVLGHEIQACRADLERALDATVGMPAIVETAKHLAADLAAMRENHGAPTMSA